MSFKDNRDAFEEAYARRSANDWRQKKDSPGYRICDWSGRVLIIDSNPVFGKMIASLLDSIDIKDSFLPKDQEPVFESMAGYYQGKKVSILHTGITPYSYGASYMDFTLERLRGFPAKKIIVVGEATGIQENMMIGDFIIPLSAIRDDDIHLSYTDENIPATADAELSNQIIQQLLARNLSDRIHSGIGWSCGNGAGVFDPALIDQLSQHHKANVLGNCLGAASAYLLGSLLGHQVASCWVVADNLFAPITWDKMFPRLSWDEGWSEVVQTALMAIVAD